MTKTIFITGATAGIGAAAARRFASAGWNVVGTGRRRERLEALAAELGERFHPLALDMTDIDAIPAAVDSLPARFAAIDCLLNNAGLAPPMAPAQEAELPAWRTVIDTNVTGLVALTHKLLPRLIERKGAVLNLSSVAATYPYRGGAVYGGTKAFVSQFSLDLRCDLHGTGVRVTAIEPGMIETEFTIVRTGGDKAASDALYRGMNPMTAQDMAETLFWVATLPAHININTLELMPVSQSFAGFQVAREE
jgi:serine 3-dehydrogenase